LTLPFFTNLNFENVLLILTTIVSLEAIYLALFIQISINRQGKAIEEVSDDIEEIQEDVEEINDSVDEIEKDIEEVSEDVEELNQSVDEIEKDVEEIAEDVEGIQDEVDEKNPDNISEEQAEKQRKDDQKLRLEKLENMLTELILEIKKTK
jgi:methyl-accepting chemotaxis protein